MKWSALSVALGLGPAAANIIAFSPPTAPDVHFSLTIPNSTAAASTGPIYIQLRAPTRVQWVGLGQGSQMAGSNMFLMYASSPTNITLSPRNGLGHFEPKPNSETQIALLPGTGIANNTMTANLRCDNCLTWQEGTGTMDVNNPASPFIFALRTGPPINSAAQDADLPIHDQLGGTAADLTRATTTTSSTNPFESYNPITDAVPFSNVPPPLPPKSVHKILIAHATLMCLAFVIFFPLFGILVPLPLPISVTKIHAPLQIFTLCLATAGMGMGIYLANRFHELKHSHPIIGIIVVGVLILFQPLMGWLQHLHFKREGGKSVFAYAHRWLGRAMVILGMINGGLGFRMVGVGEKNAPRGVVIAYGVVAGVVGVGYVVSLVGSKFKGGFGERKRSLQGVEAGVPGDEKDEEVVVKEER
ncbi:CBD9-like protein [Aspergillus ellipticus CBS 707.79]|uniref:CBD9-like protein n=1 Tax=Aspergillus ellipticus CBS 707.79 TaxID=1448320 RepID=A0A319DFJ3_9EURO|nr:CBD9-like protein [Aspergillus ellipticus CBS 707.79]